MDTTIESELSACLENLPVEKQRQVLEFARTLVTSTVHAARGAELLKLAGTIDKSDLDTISQAIEDGCERVDPDAW